MKRNHLETALDALDSQIRDLTHRIEREPKTRSGEDNPLRRHLLDELHKVRCANQGIADLLGVSADFRERNAA